MHAPDTSKFSLSNTIPKTKIPTLPPNNTTQNNHQWSVLHSRLSQSKGYVH